MKKERARMKKTIEQRLLGAIRKLITGKVKENLFGEPDPIPHSKNGDYCGLDTVNQMILIQEYKCSEKDRILGLRKYNAKISFMLSASPETELYCYAYNLAFCAALDENPTLGNVAETAYITSYKILPPGSFGAGWKVTLMLRVVVKAGNGQ